LQKKTVNVAVIGCGRIAGHHCRSINNANGVELIAVCDLIKKKADAYSKEFNVPHYINYRRMLAEHPGIDTVAVVTPSGMHYEHAAELMTAYGKNVIVEKPTFMRPSQVVDAYELADRHNLEIFPVFQNRYNRAVRRVKNALDNDELGEVRVVSVRVRWCRPQRYYELAPWRGTYAQDGGALTNQGIHHVDLLRYLVGEVKLVNATMRTLGADIEVEDTVTANIKYENGAVGTLEVTTAARPDDFEASISLVCEKGLAQIGGIAVNELQIFTPEPAACSDWSEDFSRSVYGNGHANMYQEISDYMREQREHPLVKAECLKSIRLLHAFYRSDESGGWVDVESHEDSTRLGRPDEKLASLYRTPPFD
jgi:predicted dehydrogenase